MSLGRDGCYYNGYNCDNKGSVDMSGVSFTQMKKSISRDSLKATFFEICLPE